MAIALARCEASATYSIRFAGSLPSRRRSWLSFAIDSGSFFRLNQRFPECIDVGIRVWEQMQDWHIRHLRPLNINRARRRPLADGFHHVGARAEARAAGQ